MKLHFTVTLWSKNPTVKSACLLPFQITQALSSLGCMRAKFLSLTPKLSMRRHSPHPTRHGRLCLGSAAASTQLYGRQAEPMGASPHWHQTSTHCWEVSSHLHFHGTRAVLTPRCLPEERAVHLHLPGMHIQKNHTKNIFNAVN